MSSQEPWWAYEQLPYRKSQEDWSPATRGNSPFDKIDFHLDIGCGTVPKARLGIDRFYAPDVGLAWDLEKLTYVPAPADCSPEIEAVARRGWELAQSQQSLHTLPFPDNSINGVISHHCLEHIDAGFVRLMDEIHRVMVPGSFLRIIVPIFPSFAAVMDPDHKRYFMEGVFETFCGAPDGSHWMESFSVPYTKCRFEMVSEDFTAMFPPEQRWTKDDVREMRVLLRKWPT